MNHWKILDDPGEFVKLYMLVMTVNLFALLQTWCSSYPSKTKDGYDHPTFNWNSNSL